ncbi:MAG: hypothetical protein ACK4SY_10355 [Pyrobaculum sp.]
MYEVCFHCDKADIGDTTIKVDPVFLTGFTLSVIAGYAKVDESHVYKLAEHMAKNDPKTMTDTEIALERGDEGKRGLAKNLIQHAKNIQLATPIREIDKKGGGVLKTESL